MLFVHDRMDIGVARGGGGQRDFMYFISRLLYKIAVHSIQVIVYRVFYWVSRLY